MDNNIKISDILFKYKSDKNQGLSDTRVGHYYGPAYDQVFESFNKNDELYILEIGIQKGGSLVAWNEYFPNAIIYGVDIEDNILDEYRRDDFNYIITDIKSDLAKSTLKDIKFDIIIDDGSHKLYDMMYAVANFLKNLKPNGWFIIEDCHQPESWMWAIQQLVEEEPNQHSISVYDARHINGNIDDFLILIQQQPTLKLPQLKKIELPKLKQ